jgi:hypothetical protein
MRRCLSQVLFAVATVTLSAPALAQDANCPPGAWFCEAPPPADSKAQEEAAAPDDDEEAARPAPPPPPGRVHRVKPRIRFATPPPGHVRRHPPPVVVYQPGAGPPPQIVIVAPGTSPPPAVKVRVREVEAAPAVPARPKRWHRRWGLNLRVEGAALGGHEHGGSDDAGMGGLGLSLRFRPVPAFAFDLGVDVLSGTDFNGFDRTEMPVSLSGMLFVNPKSRVQFYFLGGAHFSHAEVETNTYDPLRDGDEDASTSYSYFGGHGGIGLEFRISRLVALNIDALGFVRKRTDDGKTPEFYDPETGRSTNTSGGGLLRGGLTFWW